MTLLLSKAIQNKTFLYKFNDKIPLNNFEENKTLSQNFYSTILFSKI